MKAELREDPDYKLWVMFNQTRNAIVTARERELAEFGVSKLESYILFVIKAMGDDATPAEISRIVFRQPHTVSEFLSRMEKKGFITKSRNPKNKSMIRLRLTPKGNALYRKTSKRDSIHEIFSELSHEDREKLAHCLEIVQGKALEAIGVKRAAYFPSLDSL
jgi:DNA-binding MarR family transcriptional regulator